MEYVQMTLNDWMSLKKEIAEEFARASASFVKIGYLLRKAEDSEGYKNDGYDTLAEWAHDELGLTATYVSRFKAINAKYSRDGYSEMLRPEFIGYGSAKLGEMLALPDADMQMISPQTKREDIRALKEFNRTAPEAPDAESWILEMMEIIPEAVKRDLAAAHVVGALDGKKCSEILNPSGNSMKRTKAAMVAMTDEGLFVKTFGPAGGRRKISWQDFAGLLTERIEKWNPQADDQVQEETVTKPEENDIKPTENDIKPTENDIKPTETVSKSEETAPEPEEAEGEENSEPADIMPHPEEPEKEPEQIAPAQKPMESQTYQDAKGMMKGLEEAFRRKDWSRMLRILEGLEPAVRKLQREDQDEESREK